MGSKVISPLAILIAEVLLDKKGSQSSVTGVEKKFIPILFH